tara:strand:- start:135 stop:827 length:693 start_codon:yes stop_codon:yes gene_type:complete
MSYGKSPKKNNAGKPVNKVSASLRRLAKTAADRAPNQSETLQQRQRAQKSAMKSTGIKIGGGVIYFPFNVLWHASSQNLILGSSNASNTVEGIVPFNRSNPFPIKFEAVGDSFNLALAFEILNDKVLTNLYIGGMSAQEGLDSNKINNRFSGLLSSHSGGTTTVTLSNNRNGNSGQNTDGTGTEFRITPGIIGEARKNAKYVLNMTLNKSVLSANREYSSFGLSATTATV